MGGSATRPQRRSGDSLRMYFGGMKPPRITDPHDAFFKELFGRQELAIDFFRCYLPTQIYARIDPQSLKLVKDSFVDKELSRHFSDLLYSVRIRNRSGFIYLLFEHKSYIDPLAGFQLLRNMVKIWERHVQRAGRQAHLPLIIPMLIYHGKTEWRGQEDLRRRFSIDSELERYVPRFDIEVYDISHLPPEALRGEMLTRAAMLLFGHIFSPDLSARLPEILRLLEQTVKARGTKELIEIFIRYLLAATPQERQEELARTVKRSLKQGEIDMPSVADKLLREGFEQGIEQGIEQGVEQGVEQGAEQANRQTVMRADKQGLSVAQIAAITGMSAQKVRAILRTKKK